MKIGIGFLADVGFETLEKWLRNIFQYISPHCPATPFCTTNAKFAVISHIDEAIKIAKFDRYRLAVLELRGHENDPLSFKPYVAYNNLPSTIVLAVMPSGKIIRAEVLTRNKMAAATIFENHQKAVTRPFMTRFRCNLKHRLACTACKT